MVGKGVLLECLDSDKISEILLINRSSINLKNPKLKEIILKDFMQFGSIKEDLNGYDACFHCMGVSAAGLSEDEYTKFTFGITKSLVDTLYAVNPKMMITYVSGSGTDSTEKGFSMWARVKGKTENYILNNGFQKSAMFRAGAIIPEKGIKSKTALYQTMYTLTSPIHWLLKKSKYATTTTNLGLAMIAFLDNENVPKHLENADINELASK